MKNTGIPILIFFCVLILCLLATFKRQEEERRATVIRDTVRVTIVDTVRIVCPVVRDSLVVRYVTERLPVKRDSVQIGCTDSVDVEIPITQKRYADSTYTAWVSGYRPSLDSIHIYPRHEVVTITNTIRQKPKRWNVGLNVGYGLTPKGLQPYVGVGVSYNLFSF